MRVASRIAFGERETGNRTPKKRYFLAFEGKITEYCYFRGLIGKFRRENLNFPLIEVVLFARKNEHEGHSNPCQVVTYTTEVVHTGKFPLDITYQELFEDYVFKITGSSPDKNLKIIAYNKAQCFLSKQHKDMQSKVIQGLIEPFIKEVQEIFVQSLLSLDGLNVVKEVLDSYKLDDLSYRTGIDSVCIVVDRDAHSFTADQYDDVVERCKIENFKLFITNPCFEFFLLLHKTDCTGYSVDDIRQNCKIGQSTFIEKELKKFVHSYDKSKFPFSAFEADITTALRNSVQYAESLDEIKDSVGTNLHILIKELLSI